MATPIDLIKHPPFNPIPGGVYAPFELLRGFDPKNPHSVTETLDYKSYIYFQQQGRTTISDPFAAMVQGLHDVSIVRGMNAYLEEEMRAGRRPIAIMGGHREPRGSATYRAVARMAQLFSESGFVVASGGGPGCMEASHLGALYAGRGEQALTEAIDRMAAGSFAKLPENMGRVLVGMDGKWSLNEEYASELYDWMLPAWEIANEFKDRLTPLNRSLAVPTWHYGHEPLTPLATHVAKYFLNSIREDVLLALASCGIIFSEGRAGTLQEVFQDAAQVYYRNMGGNQPITSMLFYDSAFWTMPETPDDKVHLPVLDLLRQLFVASKNMTQVEFDQYVRTVDSPEEAVKVISTNAPPVEAVITKLNAIGARNIDPMQLSNAVLRWKSHAPGN
ncbi:LOG family protein [Massilia sp. BKSP1R2A-1]|uniref:LOG family protein n=1 Tax=Massilia sp. BKSP1R2A-1 TaxID=3422595 RepID=UPI003D32BB8E